MQKKINKIISLILFAYFLFIFGVYPLLTKDGYICLADFKYTCFIISTVIFLVLILAGIVCRKFVELDTAAGMNILDWAMIIYGVLACISFLASDYKKMALLGADGWYMGLVSQLIFIVLYFAISRGIRSWNIKNELILLPVMVLSIVAVGIGILQYAGIDMFGWYDIGYDDVAGYFFSTMGQTSWYGAYLTLFNGFAAVLMWYAIDKPEAFGNYISVTFWRVIAFVYKIIMLVGLVLIKAQAGYGVIGIILIADIVYLVWRKEKTRYLCKWILGASVILAFCVALFGLLNTIGGFGEGYRGMEGILYYDKSWGNYRGSIWAHSVNVWRSLWIKQKMFGVGPDCYMNVAYSIDTTELRKYIGSSILQNAHNEWLNSIICLGVLGGLAYLGIFVISIWNSAVRFRSNADYMLHLSMGLLVVIYVFYGCFCYQQCYSTPMIFILIAIYEGRLRSK